LSAQFKTGPLSADVVGSHLFTRTLRCRPGAATDVPTNKPLKSLRTVAIAPLKSRHASRNREKIREKLRLRRECRETCVDAELRCDKCFRFQPGEQNNRSSTSDSDRDPLYRYHQWQGNLRILGVSEIKTVPYAPLSHPFIERLVVTIRRECLISRCSGRRLIWN